MKKDNPGEKKQKVKRTEYNLNSRPFRRLGSALPKGLLSHFETKLRHIGVRDDPRVWMGMRIMVSFLFGILAFFAYLAITNPVPGIEPIATAMAWFFAAFGICAFVFYLSLYFAISDRASRVEKILPDFLLLTVSNLRAGMTPFNAFVKAAKPEFGELYNEVSISAVKAGGTASLADALIELSNYFDSKIFRRSIMLFVKGIRSGGQLTKLLRSSADEAQHIQDLRAELASSTRTYTLFLGFITVIIMPFLLSISTLFVTVFLSLQPDTNVADAQVGGIPSFSGKIFITPDEMRLISMATLALTSIFVSALAGVIQKGKALYGLKYFPVFATASIVFFFIAYESIKSLLFNFGAI